MFCPLFEGSKIALLGDLQRSQDGPFPVDRASPATCTVEELAQLALIPLYVEEGRRLLLGS